MQWYTRDAPAPRIRPLLIVLVKVAYAARSDRGFFQIMLTFPNYATFS